jgi:transketolase
VAEILSDQGMDIGVINVHTIKPIDAEGIVRLSRIYHKWISVEEHNVIGGLGSALSEVIAEKGIEVKLKKLGLNDTFAKGAGTYDDIKRANGLDAKHIEEKITEI